MFVRRLIIACVLATGSFEAAATASAGVRDQGAQHAGSMVVGHDDPAGGSDSAESRETGAAPASTAAGAKSSRDDAEDRGSPMTPAPRRTSGGWQSLLPGSIQ